MQKNRQKRLVYDQTGGVLIVALCVLVVLSVIAISLASNAKSSIYLSRRLNDDLKSSLLARSGFNKALAAIELSEISPFHFNNSYFINDSASRDLRTYEVYGDRTSDFDKHNWIHISDEEGKININYASKDELVRIPGMTERIVDCIFDWRDTDAETNPLGAESDYYWNLSKPYLCKNNNFESIEELLLIKDMNLDIYNKIINNVTVYGDGKINLNTCSLQALIALGLEENFARRIIDFRAGLDKELGTIDDFVFTNVDSVPLQLHRKMILEDSDIEQFFTPYRQGRFTVDSKCFKITSVAKSMGSAVKIRLSAIIKTDEESKPEILYWSEM